MKYYKYMATFGLTSDITYLNSRDIGGLLGSSYGLYKGATYNPDIIDPETKEKRKLGLLPRAGLVVGGSSLGTMGGQVGGSVVGGLLSL